MFGRAPQGEAPLRPKDCGAAVGVVQPVLSSTPMAFQWVVSVEIELAPFPNTNPPPVMLNVPIMALGLLASKRGNCGKPFSFVQFVPMMWR